MELEFGKHFKDATNLLLMMDHDSGYVEGSENYHAQQDLDLFNTNTSQCKKSENFLLSEDALLEKPERFDNFNEKPIESADYEETRSVFSLQDGVIDSSVKSQGSSTTVYSGLESECSEQSVEIPVQDPIIAESKDAFLDVSCTNFISNASTSDMSIESSVHEPLIIEKEKISDTVSNGIIMAPLLEPGLVSEKAINVNYSGINYEQIKTPLTENRNENTSAFVEPSCSTLVPSAVKCSASVSKEKRRLTLVFSKANKENEYRVKRKYPSITPEKKYENPVDPNISPDIFGDEEADFEIQTNNAPTQSKTEELYVDKLDHKLLKRTQKGMSGVLPPPSVTVVNMSFAEMLDRIHTNKAYFWNSQEVVENVQEDIKNTSLNSSSESSGVGKSLLVNVESVQDVLNSKWPNILNLRFHGLHHNRSKISEEIESLCEKYQKRFVGCETQSACTVFETITSSPTKRKMTKPRWGGKSPGRRLSHLARRRITFSSANLQVGGSNLAGSRARQILVDARKMELLNRRKSPRKSPRKTPSKSPRFKTRTPSSSAKKKLAMRFRKLTGEFETSVPGTSEVLSARKTFVSPSKMTKSENSKGISMNTKRALFQSPNRDKNSSLIAGNSQSLLTSAEKSKLRRALFSSPKKSSPLKGKHSPFKRTFRFGFEKKRKRSESDDIPPSKFSRSMSVDMRTSSFSDSRSISRTQSDINVSLNRSGSQYELTDPHKKKLQWAVYSALQINNITKEHPQWKNFAAVLGKVTRYFFTSQMISSAAAGVRLEGGTTERMNRIAKVHILSVIKGKSADEIITEYLKNRPKVLKPQGYIAPEEYNNMKNKATSGHKDNVLQDRANTIESWERERVKQLVKPSTTDNRIERIRKVINFGDDR